ncbi:hypothetical protein SODALDRAFT_82756 [Sodiomyces alkalinus F11]|uniref:Uncharacterized protein n=1 Tax=Sodiomyces alkalinus (strain CBS 110278 / VKM F-3762 / F11) TaxID=1314773 RepID=A0A3N2PK37_SODAK|nr:hypothetical protein SODALDRAFT_82756 [Sodiomyces alkalinus F11]ROT34676.1 hypothetical protein SODALDRAFT_82756 [Sodiomyces alkalinus F11]
MIERRPQRKEEKKARNRLSRISLAMRFAPCLIFPLNVCRLSHAPSFNTMPSRINCSSCAKRWGRNTTKKTKKERQPRRKPTASMKPERRPSIIKHSRPNRIHRQSWPLLSMGSAEFVTAVEPRPNERRQPTTKLGQGRQLVADEKCTCDLMHRQISEAFWIVPRCRSC